MKQYTKYQKTFLVEICVCFIIYKLVHGAIFNIYSKCFVEQKSTMCLILYEFVYGFNGEYKDLIILPQVGAMSIVTKEIKNWCSLPNTQNAIDGTQNLFRMVKIIDITKHLDIL